MHLRFICNYTLALMLTFPSIVFAKSNGLRPGESARFLPTVRTELATASVFISQNELDGLLQFAKDHKVNLDTPVPIEVKAGKLFFFNDEIVFNKNASTVNFKGMVFKRPKGQALDVFVANIYQNLKSKNSSAFMKLLLPHANAVDTSSPAYAALHDGLLYASIASMVIGTGLETAAAKGTSLLRIGRGLGSAGFLGIVIQIMIPRPARASELLKVKRAQCDANGINITFNDGSLRVTEANGKIKMDRNNQEVSLPNESRPEAESQFRTLIEACRANPEDPERFATQIQNAITADYKMQVANSASASGKTSESAQPVNAVK